MNNRPTRTPPPSSSIRQDYKHREDCNPSLRYTGPERRGRPQSVPMQAIRRYRDMLRLVIIVMLALLLTLVVTQTMAQTPQDGYDSLNMAPQGLYWQNPVQGYSEPAADRYRPPPSYFQPDQAPTYYNEWGQPSTTPDPRQYERLEGVQM